MKKYYKRDLVLKEDNNITAHADVNANNIGNAIDKTIASDSNVKNVHIDGSDLTQNTYDNKPTLNVKANNGSDAERQIKKSNLGNKVNYNVEVSESTKYMISFKKKEINEIINRLK